jgi:uncharacterized membrane protein YbhN (UPF0104 family)
MMQNIDTDPVVAPARSTHLRYLSLAVSASLLAGGIFVMYRWISGPEILDRLRRLDWGWLIPAILVCWLQYPVVAMRMDRVLHWLRLPGSGAPPPFRLVLKLTLSAGFIAVVAPATLPLQWRLGVAPALIGVQVLLSAGFLAAIGVLLFLPNALRIFKHRFILTFAHGASGYEMLLPWRRSAIVMAFAAVNLILAFFVLCCLLRAMALTPNLVVVACFIPFLQLVSSLPFLYMGWGGREIAMAATLGTASGMSLNEALLVSAAWGITTILVGAVNGVFIVGAWQAHAPGSSPPAEWPPAP